MKKLLLISLFAGVLPLSMTAQDDDLYFVPKKKSVEMVTDHYGMPKGVYYSGSNRSIDEYNRRTISHYELIGADSIMNDTISFIAEKGVYPDSIASEDFTYTKKLSRFDDYDMTDNAAFWAGYEAGRYDWGWHSPWYYSRFGWYDYWYDPWYYSWYDPYYYGWYGGWYRGWYGSWYSPWYYSWYGHPWYYSSYNWVGTGGRYHYTPTIGAGSIRRDGSTFGSRNSSIARNSSRMNELRNRTVSGNSRNVGRSRNSNGYRNSGNYNNNSSFSGSRSSNSSSFSGSRSSGGGGSFSGGGGSHSSGGGSRMGGRR